MTCDFDAAWFTRVQQHAAIESARFWLNESYVRLPKGMVGRYQEMAKRGQYFAHLAERLNVTPAELDRHLTDHAISDAEHAELLNRQPADLFSLVA